jgi:hypothetical protein
MKAHPPSPLSWLASLPLGGSRLMDPVRSRTGRNGCTPRSRRTRHAITPAPLAGWLASLPLGGSRLMDPV